MVEAHSKHHEVKKMSQSTIIHEGKEYQYVAVIGSHPKGKSVIFEITFGVNDTRKLITYLEITNIKHMPLASMEPRKMLEKGIECFKNKHFVALIESGETKLELPML